MLWSSATCPAYARPPSARPLDTAINKYSVAVKDTVQLVIHASTASMLLMCSKAVMCLGGFVQILSVIYELCCCVK